MIDPNIARLPERTLLALKQNAMTRIEVLRGYRLTWWAHWASLAEMFLPRRYKWFITPNNWNRGSPINQSIVDETGVVAARVLATGLLSGLTSPTKPWFRLGLHGVDSLPEGPVADYLAACTNTILAIYAGTNFYSARGVLCHDLGVFGSAAMIQYEDDEDVVRFYNPCLGEFFFAVSNRLEVDTLAREYTYTYVQTISEFGIENVSPSTALASTSAGNTDTEIVIGHIIEPNTEVFVGGKSLGLPLPSRFKYRELYWEKASAGGQKSGWLLRLRGYVERPFSGARWDVNSNDAYGRSPGMDALPAVRQLQVEQRRKAEAIDKQVRPPMKASVSMKNEPMDIMPGGVTFVTDMSNQSGFAPVYQVQPQIQEMKEDLAENQARVKTIMFNDLFNRFPTETVRTATEDQLINEERIVQLGPVIERTETEDLSIHIQRTFSIALRRGLLPPPPPELAGAALKIEYISFLAQAQKAQSISAVSQWLALGGNLVGVKPDVMDNYNVDEIVEYVGDTLNVPPNLANSEDAIAQIRAQREQAQQQAAALQVGQAAASGAQTLSQTNIGGGKNALQAVMGS